LWRAEQLGGLELLRATFVTHAFSRHTHDTFALGVVEDGLHSFWYGGATHLVPPQAIVVLNPDTVHTGQAARLSGYTTYRMLYPSPALVQQVADALWSRSRGLPYFPHPVIHDPDLAHQIRAFHLTVEHPTSALEREMRLMQVLTLLVLRHAEVRPAEPRRARDRGVVCRARAYLDAHYADDVSLAHLARVAEVSPFYLARAFRADVGVPPHTYLEGVRVAQAKTLLLAGRALADVAFATGFVDQSHFTHRFKRSVGVTPGQYAQQGRRAR
jgi:AraC-like DNA-binding protein